MFRSWKTLEESFRTIPGIKKQPMAEVRFDAVVEEGVRKLEVTRLVNESNWLVPWKDLAFKRWEKLNQIRNRAINSTNSTPALLLPQPSTQRPRE